jgi:hypothetical protein
MGDLINEYAEDPDAQKLDSEAIMSTSVTMTSIPVKRGSIYHGSKTSAITST